MIADGFEKQQRRKKRKKEGTPKSP